jgi:hypothetical protein
MRFLIESNLPRLAIGNLAARGHHVESMSQMLVSTWSGAFTPSAFDGAAAVVGPSEANGVHPGNPAYSRVI